MSYQRWEYLIVVQEHKAEQRSRRTADGNETYWHFEFFWYIYRPGVEKADQPDGWSTTRPDGLGIVTLLNDLGSDGWELMSENVMRSALSAHSFGWGTSSSMPIQTKWLFKRPILNP
jgi:hypothetical protein